MALFHAAHAAANSLFYERPGMVDDASEPFEVTAIPGWDSWKSVADSRWIHWLPTDSVLPEQGWKIHVSATPTTARRALELASAYCNRERIAFKHLRSAGTLATTLAKDCDRASSGKFITIYPKTEDELLDCLSTLDGVLGGAPGPYILSDLRWREGPLFVRYGAFHLSTVVYGGVRVPAVRNLDTAELVPDVRDAAFTVPSWVAMPDFLHEQLNALGTEPPADFPRVLSALHYSNAGGVYVAEQNGISLILKEARPHSGWTPDGRDAVARLKHEEAVLRKLPTEVHAPKVIGAFSAHGHLFLALEQVDGTPLPVLLATRHPLTVAEPSNGQVAEYREWALGVARSLRAAVDALHRAGWVHGDLHPGNVLVHPDGEVTLIDFEMSTPVGDESVAVIGAPGFVATDGRSAVARDLYAVACIELHLFLPLVPLLRLDPSKVGQLLRTAQQAFDLDPEWSATLKPTLTRRDWSADRFESGIEHRLDTQESIDRIAGALLTDGDASDSHRLWPGDPLQFDEPGYALSFGALGVASVLALAGQRPTEAQLAWIEDEVVRPSRLDRPGLMDGLAGAVWGCRRLGLHAAADVALHRMEGTPPTTSDPTLYSGLAGIALTLLSESDRRPDRLSRAVDIAEHLRRHWLSTPVASRVQTDRGGLLRGAGGTTILAVRLFERTADESFLDLARIALEHDVATLVRGRDGSLHVDEGWRAQPYLGFGSAGIGVALLNYLRHRPDENAHRTTLDDIILAARARMTAQAGLLHGRAGLVQFLCLVERFRERSELVESALRHHIDSLGLHAFTYDGGLRFAGDGLLRASCDLASGSAGVLSALLAQRASVDGMSLDWYGLPYLTPGSDTAPIVLRR